MKKTRILVVVAVLLASFAIGATFTAPASAAELQQCDYIEPFHNDWCKCCIIHGKHDICKIILCP